MVMEREGFIEKQAQGVGLSGLKVKWAKVAGPSVMNDGLLSGSIHFAAQGAPSLITLWDRTRSNVAAKGVAAMTTYPLYLITRNPDVKTIRDFGPKDKIAVPSVKISTQAIMVGYHGESVRSLNHRQSGTNGRSTQVGFPIAPARWATPVSIEITRSRADTRAAVSAKSFNSAV